MADALLQLHPFPPGVLQAPCYCSSSAFDPALVRPEPLYVKSYCASELLPDKTVLPPNLLQKWVKTATPMRRAPQA